MIRINLAISRLAVIAAAGMLAAAQPITKKSWTADHPPRFEDCPVRETWNGVSAPVKLASRSERMFRTNLTNAAKEPPNFAGHYRLMFWGCGSNCAAGALIDLETGEVSQPPQARPNASGWDRWIISAGMMEGAGIDFRIDSRLVVVRSGISYSERVNKNIPNVAYFLWEDNRFRRILFVLGEKSGH